MIITGYRLNTVEIPEVENEIGKLKRKIEKIASREYGKLLGEEIAFMVDQIALNIIPRDKNNSIYNNALGNVKYRIQNAAGSNTKYNFSCYVNVMTENGYTYFQVICPNQSLLAAFKGLEEYSINETESADESNAKTRLWNKLHKEYSMTVPLSLNLTPAFETPEKEMIKYPTVADRRATEARHTMLNKYMNQLANGQQIPPFLTQRFFDDAMLMVMQKQDELKRMEMELTPILVDLEKDDSFVYEVPGQMAVEPAKQE